MRGCVRHLSWPRSPLRWFCSQRRACCCAALRKCARSIWASSRTTSPPRRYSLPQKQYSKQPQIDAFNRELLLRLRRLPASRPPGSPATAANRREQQPDIRLEGYMPPKGADMNLATRRSHGRLLPALGIPLLRGRLFTEADRPAAQLVLIVNHKLAQHYWPGQDPIGKRLRLGTPEMQTPWMTVVGEVADVELARRTSRPKSSITSRWIRARTNSARWRIPPPT